MKYININTYDIVENPMVFAVDPRLANIISILNKKGYYTSGCDISCVEKVDVFRIMLNKIFKNNVIDSSLDEETIKSILMYSSGSIFIIFDKKYNLLTPKGFYKFQNGLACDMIPVKQIDSIMHIKTKEELNQEVNEKLKNLTEWANELPNRNC